jgi:hypothetical protein
VEITKSQLKQIIKEEMDAVLAEAEEVKAIAPTIAAMSHGKAKLDNVGQQAVAITPKKAKLGPLKQFIKDNPEVMDYFGAGAVAIKESDPPIDPKWMEKGEGAGTEWTIVRYKSMEERKIAKNIYEKVEKEGPFVKKVRDTGRQYIGTISYDSMVSGKHTQLRQQGTHSKTGDHTKSFVSDVSHHLTKAYFHPLLTLESYIKAHGKDKAYNIYKYTADQIENIIGKPVPGSSKTGGKPSGKIYLYSYVHIGVRMAGEQTGKMGKSDRESWKSMRKDVDKMDQDSQ